MKLNMGRSKVRVLCCVSGTILLASLTCAATGNIRLLAAGQKAKVTGSILCRDGDLVPVLDKQSGEEVFVNITDSARIESKKGGQLDAGKISFTPDEFAIEVPQKRPLLATKTTAENASHQNNANGKSNGNRDDWVHAWLRKVDNVRASQPHFVSPIVTTHVMLVQQYRYDMSWQQDPVGDTITANYGASRGLEIIPTTRLEVGIFPPSYLVHQSHLPDGFGDLSFQVKFRAFSATEGKGDYFVGFFLGASLPTGTGPNGLGHATLSPTFAAAKGIGHWDIQSTIGANLPTSGTNLLGRTILFNTAVNYRIKGIIWPMLEQNSTFWKGGILDGEKEVFLTPGLVLGSFPLAERLRFAAGGGLQIAVTPFHQYNHRWILSLRFPF